MVPQPLGVWGLGLPTRVQSVPEKTGVCVETLELRTHPLARENLSIYIFSLWEWRAQVRTLLSVAVLIIWCHINSKFCIFRFLLILVESGCSSGLYFKLGGESIMVPLLLLKVFPALFHIIPEFLLATCFCSPSSHGNHLLLYLLVSLCLGHTIGRD